MLSHIITLVLGLIIGFVVCQILMVVSIPRIGRIVAYSHPGPDNGVFRIEFNEPIEKFIRENKDVEMVCFKYAIENDDR